MPQTFYLTTFHPFFAKYFFIFSYFLYFFIKIIHKLINFHFLNLFFYHFSTILKFILYVILYIFSFPQSTKLYFKTFSFCFEYLFFIINTIKIKKFFILIKKISVFFYFFRFFLDFF